MTRNNPSGATKKTPTNTTPARQSATPAATATSNPDLVDDADLPDLLASLSRESKTLVKIMKTVITKQLRSELETMREEISKKDAVIDKLDGEVKDLKTKVHDLEAHIDRVEQYERRDTIIISGPSLPSETPTENTSTVVIDTIKEHLKLNLKPEDLSVTHRLGPSQPGRDRPMIVKLVNRSLKYDIMGACVQLRPKLYVNESHSKTTANFQTGTVHP